MDISEVLKDEIINVSHDRIKIYKKIRYRCDDDDDIVKFCDFQIKVLESIIGI